MRLISIRKGFQSDHSSTSYEFLAVDKKLTATQKKTVGNLSSRACPTDKRVSFVYNGDFSDLPGGWKPLVEKYYDVMYSESYDWWTLAFAFNADEKTIETLQKYAFDGVEDLGVRVDVQKKRAIVAVYCRIEYNFDYFSDSNDNRGYGYGYYEDEKGVNDSDDEFLTLLKENREYLKKGDYRLLYGIWEKYGLDEDDNESDQLPKPARMDHLPEATSNLLSMLESM